VLDQEKDFLKISGIAPTEGNTDKDALNSDKAYEDRHEEVIPKWRNHRGKVGVVCAAGVLGSSIGEFDVSIPRQKWTHLSFVCTRRPKNRIALYKVTYTDF
jgi:hypothetical protein